MFTIFRQRLENNFTLKLSLVLFSILIVLALVQFPFLLNFLEKAGEKLTRLSTGDWQSRSQSELSHILKLELQKNKHALSLATFSISIPD